MKAGSGGGLGLFVCMCECSSLFTSVSVPHLQGMQDFSDATSVSFLMMVPFTCIDVSWDSSSQTAAECKCHNPNQLQAFYLLHLS